MQVSSRGQKKPGQHGLQFSALDGTGFSNELFANELGSGVEHAQPDWHPDAHEIGLQFLLILVMRLLPKLLRYNSISALLHIIATNLPWLCSLHSEMKLGSELKLNVWLKSSFTLDMQKPYLLCTSSASSWPTVCILAMSTSEAAADGDGGRARSPSPCWHRPPAGSSARTRGRSSTAARGAGSMVSS